MNPAVNNSILSQTRTFTVWYMPGGGGNWLNYMVWCYLYNQNIPGNYKNFHIHTLLNSCCDYSYILGVAPHQTPWNECSVVLGSHRSLLNLFINNCGKLGYTLDNIVNRALLFQKNYDWSVGYNIQWHLIANDHKTFLEALSDVLKIKITYTVPVQHAFQQYIDSCWSPELQGDAWLNHPLTEAYIQALEIRGFPKQTVFDHWTKYSPLN